MSQQPWQVRVYTSCATEELMNYSFVTCTCAQFNTVPRVKATYPWWVKCEYCGTAQQMTKGRCEGCGAPLPLRNADLARL